MAVQDPGMDIGYCVSNFDARNSSITGTTLLGPNGSGQFLFVQLSTAADYTIGLATGVGAQVFGVLQNKPSTGIAADVRFMGVTKLVSGSTAIGAGMLLENTTGGVAIPQTTGLYAAAKALQAATAVGQIFSAMIYGAGAPVSLP